MKKKKTILAAIVLLLVFVVGGAIAYFTDTDSATNTFTIGNVDIDLVESTWENLDTDTVDKNNNKIPDAAEDMMPGETVDKDPVVKNLSTKNPAYVFVKVEVPCSNIITTAAPDDEETPVELFRYSVNTGWTELTSAKVACSTAGSTATHVYYYGNSTTLTELAKAANDSTPTATPALFNSVTLLETLKSSDIPNLTDAKNIVVTGYGIQTEGLTSTTPAAVWANFS